MKPFLLIIFLFLLPIINTSLAATGHQMQVIKGTVKDYHSGKAVPHLELQVEGTSIAKTTDAYGRFKFQLSDTFAGKNVILNVTPTGQLFLDSTGSLINETKLNIDSLPFKRELTIYRYPLGTLQPIKVVSGRSKFIGDR